MDALTATYSVSEADFMKACEAHWRARKMGSALGTLVGLAAVLLGAAVAWLYPSGVIHKLALAIVVVGGVYPLVIILRYFIWRKAYRDARKFQDSIAVTFTDDGIHVESAAGVSDLNWSAYNRFLMTPDFYILYMARNTFSVIPRTAFNAADRDALEQLLKRKLKPA